MSNKQRKLYQKATDEIKVKKDVNTVNLWLGANTMVEYTLDEAKVLLSKNLVNAKGNLKTYVIIIKIQIKNFIF